MVLPTKTIIFITIVVLLFVAGVSFFVTAIVKRKNRQKSLAFAFTSFLFFLFSIITGGYLVGVIGERIIPDSEEIQLSFIQKLKKASLNNFPESSQLDSIRSFQWGIICISDDYYTYCGEWNYYRMPLVVPFEMNAIDDLDDGYITNELKTDLFLGGNQAKQLESGIIRFAFDESILIAEQKLTADTPARYIIFPFYGSHVEVFNSLSDMQANAKSKGFDLNTPMVSVRDYYMSLWNH